LRYHIVFYVKKNHYDARKIWFRRLSSEWGRPEGVEQADSLWRILLGKIKKNYNVIDHRQVRDTECPGQTFYKLVNLPRWTANPKPNICLTPTTKLIDNTVEKKQLSECYVYDDISRSLSNISAVIITNIN